MAVWLVRTGSKLPRHDFALDKNVVVVGCDEMSDLSTFATRDPLEAGCKQAYPTHKPSAIRNWSRFTASVPLGGKGGQCMLYDKRTVSLSRAGTLSASSGR